MDLQHYKNLDEINEWLKQHPEEIDKLLDEIEKKQELEAFKAACVADGDPANN